MKYKSRKHVVLLYPDCPEHVIALDLIKSSIDYIAILHDKDVDDDCKLKKSHWHVVLNYKNATWSSAVSKEFGIPENYIQQCRNEEAALEYLIHANEESKHQYGLDEIFGTKNLINKLKNSLEKDELTEGDKVIELIEIIENSDKKISISNFARSCAAMGRWDVFRRSGSIFLKMIEEKNRQLDL